MHYEYYDYYDYCKNNTLYVSEKAPWPGIKIKSVDKADGAGRNFCIFIYLNKLAIYTGLIGLTMGLISCDAILFMQYRVKNTTGEKIKLKITHYPLEIGIFKPTVDTIIELEPKASVCVGAVHDIGFPWDTKSLFYKYPSCENFELMQGDSILVMDISEKNWTYWSATSVFKVKKKHLHPALTKK
jgi:hypothetical protein